MTRKTLKVCIVAPTLEFLGGQGVQADLLLQALRDERWDVSFLPINPPFPRPLRRLRRYPYLRTLVNQAFYLPSLARLRRFDVVHVFSASYWSFLLSPVPALLAGRLFRRGLILNYRSGEAADHLKRWGKVIRPFLRMGRLVVPSEYLRQVFHGHGYDATVIQNFVDFSAFRYRERYPLAPRLVSTRNLEPMYNVANTIRAFGLVKRRVHDATLAIAGYGSEEAKLRRLAASLGVERDIRFLGRVERNAIHHHYDGADLFVNSSEIDNQPVSILEAFAAGTPVVTTDAGGIPFIVRDGENGLLVPQRDPETMSDALLSLLKDPDRALGIARTAWQEVQRYSWQEVKQSWMRLYQESAA